MLRILVLVGALAILALVWLCMVRFGRAGQGRRWPRFILTAAVVMAVLLALWMTVMVLLVGPAMRGLKTYEMSMAV